MRKTDKILFIVPPYIKYDSYINPAFNERTVTKKSGVYGSVVTDMPIGLLSLSAYLKKNTDVEIRLIDFNIVLNRIENFKYSSFSEMFHEILSSKEWIDYAPTIIGISALFTPAYYNMIDIANVAKKIFPKEMIIAGGGVPTNMYNEIFRDSRCFDALCYGEGEKPLLGFVEAVDKKEFLKKHQTWITRAKVKKKQLFKYDFIENLDEIPFYNYDILNINAYGLSPTISNFTSFSGKNRLFHIATSRGCPYRCCFCASHTVHGRKMRYHSVSRIRRDLRRLREHYGAKTIGIQDDNYMIDKKRAFEIIGIIKKLKMTVFFRAD